MAGGGLNGVVNQAASAGGGDSARPSAPLPTPQQPMSYDRWYTSRGATTQDFNPARDQAQYQDYARGAQPVNPASLPVGSGPARYNPYQQQQRPQQAPWQQSSEWQGYQTQMTDLQNQLNQSPIMQQIQQLQNKMQGYQQQQQQYAPPRLSSDGLIGLAAGLQAMYGGRGFNAVRNYQQDTTQNQDGAFPPGLLGIS